ncbi:hypothetical protein TIFTF001_046468 [Ficus carica]|uniref:Uncharacterized protein n=1 Tax=Ficus carica TaxID=3494 RepID=A0AA88CTF2_FICCA|nr:hypothetical protein TIFTF001_046468 [Ficus carica]
MRDVITPYVEPGFSMDNSGTHPVLEEELTLTNGGRQGNTRRTGNVASPSWSRGSSGHIILNMNEFSSASGPEEENTSSEYDLSDDDGFLVVAVVAVAASGHVDVNADYVLTDRGMIQVQVQKGSKMHRGGVQ